MTTLLDRIRSGEMPDIITKVASEENVDPPALLDSVASGKAVVVGGGARKARRVGIGKGLRTKVNASIGTSSDIINIEMEIQKAKIAEEAGADTLMELSTGGDLDLIRRTVLKSTTLPVGNVPLYQAAIDSIERFGSVVHMTPDFLFETVEKQLTDGIGFMAIHCGINLSTLERLRKQGYRYGGLVSRGGAFMVAWMIHNEKENPLYSQFDRLVEIFGKHDAVLSLGNGMRAGAVHDSTDRAQIQELIMNAELADYAHSKGVQVIVEGPGHIPIDEIQANVLLEKRLTNEKPFYMLGPLVTDVAPGYDHITAAIGAALSSAYGADFICYVTPPEHLALPFPEDVRTGVITARIAAHVGDMIKLGRRDADLAMARARRDLDWEKQFEFAIDPATARRIREERAPADSKTCTMCGKYCALKIVKKYFECDIGPCK